MKNILKIESFKFKSLKKTHTNWNDTQNAELKALRLFKLSILPSSSTNTNSTDLCNVKQCWCCWWISYCWTETLRCEPQRWRCSSDGAPVHSQSLWSPSDQCCWVRIALFRHKTGMSFPHIVRKPQSRWYQSVRHYLREASRTAEACRWTSEPWTTADSEERTATLRPQTTQQTVIYLV